MHPLPILLLRGQDSHSLDMSLPRQFRDSGVQETRVLILYCGGAQLARSSIKGCLKSTDKPDMTSQITINTNTKEVWHPETGLCQTQKYMGTPNLKNAAWPIAPITLRWGPIWMLSNPWSLTNYCCSF